MDMTGEAGVETADYRSSSTIFVKYYVCNTVFTNKDKYNMYKFNMSFWHCITNEFLNALP